MCPSIGNKSERPLTFPAALCASLNLQDAGFFQIGGPCRLKSILAHCSLKHGEGRKRPARGGQNRGVKCRRGRMCGGTCFVRSYQIATNEKIKTSSLAAVSKPLKTAAQNPAQNGHSAPNLGPFCSESGSILLRMAQNSEQNGISILLRMPNVLFFFPLLKFRGARCPPGKEEE